MLNVDWIIIDRNEIFRKLINLVNISISMMKNIEFHYCLILILSLRIIFDYNIIIE